VNVAALRAGAIDRRIEAVQVSRNHESEVAVMASKMAKAKSKKKGKPAKKTRKRRAKKLFDQLLSVIGKSSDVCPACDGKPTSPPCGTCRGTGKTKIVPLVATGKQTYPPGLRGKRPRRVG
jgi:hypothetical protein